MGLKGLTKNTAPETEPHIYAEDDAAIYQSIVGEDGVFTVGQQCAATVLSNNKVRIADGVINVGGHFARIPYGDYEDCEIANGQTGVNRNDIIVGKFTTTGSGGIDEMTCEVKQGTAAETATDPELTQGNLYEGEPEREMPLYRVKLEGLNIVAVEQMFTVIPTIEQAKEELDALREEMQELSTRSNQKVFASTFNAGYVYRSGLVKRLKLSQPITNFTAGTAYELGTLPEVYRPKTELVHKFVCIACSTTKSIMARLFIEKDGAVTVTPYADRASGDAFQIDEIYF